MPAANRDVIVYLLGALTVIVKDPGGSNSDRRGVRLDKTAAMADAIKGVSTLAKRKSGADGLGHLRVPALSAPQV